MPDLDNPLNPRGTPDYLVGGGGGGDEAGPGADNFADASPLYLGSVVTTNNASATAESGEPEHGGETPIHSLWWKWECAATEQVAVSLVGSSFDTVLQTYTGGPTMGELVQGPGGDDNFGVMSAIRLDAEAGTTYYIAVDAPYDAGGDIRLELHANPEDDPYYLAVNSQALTELDVSGYANLTLLNCSGDMLTTLDIGSNPLLRGLICNSNQLTEAAVNAILTTLDGNGLSNGFVRLTGTGNAAPSGAGVTAKTNLQGKGWGVQTNT